MPQPVEKKRHHPSCPANRRGTPEAIRMREAGSLNFSMRPYTFVKKDRVKTTNDGGKKKRG